jgi:hydroxyacylglutathione hydrolase
MIKITPIRLSLPYQMGAVNCYLLKDKTNFLLVDTGSSNARAELEKTLVEVGCAPGALKLIVLTHGDFDHSGNAAYLAERFEAPVAMHASDSGMVERGDMFVNRKQPNWLIRKLIPFFTGFGKRERFTPDVLIEEPFDLSNYGFKAKVLSIPGHSLGSIGILTSEGDLLCGDLFENQDAPRLNSIMDDKAAAEVSLARLRGYTIKNVYPGHGEPFESLDLIRPSVDFRH